MLKSQSKTQGLGEKTLYDVSLILGSKVRRTDVVFLPELGQGDLIYVESGQWIKYKGLDSEEEVSPDEDHKEVLLGEGHEYSPQHLHNQSDLK